MFDIEKQLWKKGEITLDEKGFHVPNDDRDGVIKKFLLTIIGPESDDEIEQIFAPNSEGFFDDPFVSAFRITELEDVSDYFDWLEYDSVDDTTVNIDKIMRDEIWSIKVSPLGAQALKGDDIRYLVKEARKLWAELEKKTNKRASAPRSLETRLGFNLLTANKFARVVFPFLFKK